jgi:type IV fimbrial biogenesis protein FimT
MKQPVQPRGPKDEEPGALEKAPRGYMRKNAQGFTIVELLITVTVLGILAAVALPSLGNFVRDQRVKTAISDVYASFIYARSEAIKRSADVQVVPNGTDWAAGWTVKDSGGASLKVQGAISGVAISGEAGTITYRRDGRLSAAIATFVLSSPDSSSVTARCLRIDPSGRPNIKVDSNGDPTDGCQ